MSWSSMVQRLKQKYGKEKYEWMVARHMWHVIARRLAKGMPGCDIPDWKWEIVNSYEVAWASDCWLCDQSRLCPACPLKSCNIPGSAYYRAYWGDADAARYIEEVIYAVRNKM